MKIVDLSKILTKYKSSWIALSADNKSLITTGKTLEEVLQKAKKKGIDNPSVLKAPPVNNLFVGYG